MITTSTINEKYTICDSRGFWVWHRNGAILQGNDLAELTTDFGQNGVCSIVFFLPSVSLLVHFHQQDPLTLARIWTGSCCTDLRNKVGTVTQLCTWQLNLWMCHVRLPKREGEGKMLTRTGYPGFLCSKDVWVILVLSVSILVPLRE